MAIELTDAALKKIIELKMQRQSPDDLLRFGLKSGGCSGFTFITEFVSISNDKDRIFDFDQNVKICIDPKSYLFLNGTIIDYENGPFKSGLTFKVPSVSRTCGCGESISF